MKHLIKFLLVGICILLIATPSSPAKETPTLQADYQIKPATVKDNTYVIYIWNNQSTLFYPRWIDQFEFDAGDVFSAYTTRHGELTGKWIESQLLGETTWFQAWVEKTETTTTTSASGTTTTSAPATLASNQLKNNSNLKFDINIWGISYTLTPPEPFNNNQFSILLGNGAYLGSEAFFIGFASVSLEGEFGSINPASAEQGDTGVLVTITGKNTNFETGKTTVTFGQGITVVGTVDVDSPTELSVEIDIDAAATIGKRTVTVTYDTGTVTGANVFEVLENTN